MRVLVVVFLISCGSSLNDAHPLEFPKLPDLGMLLNKNILGKPTLNMPAIPGQIQTKTFKYVSVN